MRLQIFHPFVGIGSEFGRHGIGRILISSEAGEIFLKTDDVGCLSQYEVKYFLRCFGQAGMVIKIEHPGVIGHDRNGFLQTADSIDLAGF